MEFPPTRWNALLDATLGQFFFWLDVPCTQFPYANHTDDWAWTHVSYIQRRQSERVFIIVLRVALCSSGIKSFARRAKVNKPRMQHKQQQQQQLMLFRIGVLRLRWIAVWHLDRQFSRTSNSYAHRIDKHMRPKIIAVALEEFCCWSTFVRRRIHNLYGWLSLCATDGTRSCYRHFLLYDDSEYCLLTWCDDEYKQFLVGRCLMFGSRIK